MVDVEIVALEFDDFVIVNVVVVVEIPDKMFTLNPIKATGRALPQ